MGLLYVGLARAYNSASRAEDGTVIPNEDREIVDVTGLTTINLPDDWGADEILNHLIRITRTHTPDDGPTWYATDDKRLGGIASVAWPDAEVRTVKTVDPFGEVAAES